MALNIVLCSDGTGNRGGKQEGTNVWNLYTALDRGSILPRQVAFHDDGVGTEKNSLLRKLGGVTGFGITRNIKDLYKFLILNYEKDANLYFFGFSRGAYTVRAAVALVVACGILDRDRYRGEELDKAIDEIVDIYKARPGSKEEPDSNRWVARFLALIRSQDRKSNEEPSAYFARSLNPYQFANKSPTIEFVGVWDTVSAVGLPFDCVLRDVVHHYFGFDFHNHRLSRNVVRGCHAIAIDDERKSFHPELWYEGERPDGTPITNVEQVWFSGVHSNVGGGYPRDGMARVVLQWMMAKVERKAADGKGLVFDPDARTQIRLDANIYDLMYDSREGLAGYYRYSPRNLSKLKKMFHLQKIRVHWTAVDRMLHASPLYNPGALMLTDVEIVCDDNLNQYHKQTIDACNVKLSDVQAMVGKPRQALDRLVLLRKLLQAAFFAVTFVVAGAMAWAQYGDWTEGGFDEKIRTGLEWVLPDVLAAWTTRLISLYPIFCIGVGVVLLVLFVFKRGLRLQMDRLCEQTFRVFR